MNQNRIQSPDIAMLHRPRAELLTMLRHGQRGHATDTHRYILRGLDGLFYEFNPGEGMSGACFVPFLSTSIVSISNGTTAFTVPAMFDGWNLADAVASVHTKGISGSTDVMIRRRRAGSNVDMLTTAITIGDEFFARDGVINLANDDLATGDQLYVDVDAVHSNRPYGLSVALTFQKP